MKPVLKSVLVIIGQGPLAGQTLLEAISATMVMATYGLNLKVCLLNEAVALLQPPLNLSNNNSPFKSAHQMIESFEFYDLLPLMVCRDQQYKLNQISPAIDYILVDFNTELLQQFDQVIYW